jgi:hypothetical protein
MAVQTDVERTRVDGAVGIALSPDTPAFENGAASRAGAASEKWASPSCGPA